MGYQLDLLHRASHGELGELEALRGESQLVSLDASYGVSSALTLGLVVPFVFKSQVVRHGAGEARRSLAGPGDPLLLVKLAVLGADETRPAALRLGLLGGVKLPFGRSRVADELGTLPPSFQLGSGAAELLAGLHASGGPFRRATLFGSLVYRHPMESALGYRFGRSLAASADLRIVHLWPLAVTAGLRVTWSAMDELYGNPQHGSGGGRLLAHAGLAYYPSSWLFLQLDLVTPVWSGLHDALTSRLALALAITLTR